MTMGEMRTLFLRGKWNWRRDSHQQESDRAIRRAKLSFHGVRSLYRDRR